MRRVLLTRLDTYFLGFSGSNVRSIASNPRGPLLTMNLRMFAAYLNHFASFLLKNGCQVGLLILPLLLISCSQPEERHEMPRPVRLEKALSSTEGRLRSFSGTAQASVESKLSFKVAGTLDAVLVSVGDRVYTDQLIALLDPHDYELQVEEAEAALRRAQAAARNQAANYARARALYASRTASRTELDAARAASESAEAAVVEVQKRLELAQKQLDYTQLRAPDSGHIAQVFAEVNENVAAGMPVVRMTSGRHIEVAINIPERLIHHVAKASEAMVTFDALPGEQFEGVVTKVGVATTHPSTTFPVTVQLMGSPLRVRSGMAADVWLTFSNGESSAITVPSVAVGEDLNGRFVWIAEPQNEQLAKAERRAVQVGELIGPRIEIIEGLQASELVITAGIRQLKEGQLVMLPQE